MAAKAISAPYIYAVEPAASPANHFEIDGEL